MIQFHVFTNEHTYFAQMFLRRQNKANNNNKNMAMFCLAD